MQKKSLIVAAVFFSSHSIAQQRDSSFKSLDEVVITATRYPLKQSETGKVLSVINREQLEKSGGKTIPEILNSVAGISVNGANNNLGSIQTVNIRGASAGNVLILIDGIPVNDPSVIYNYFDLNLLVADQLERIEILKGGQSTLYGSDAVAGVINFITKKNGERKNNLSAGLDAGSYGTLRTNLGWSGNHGIASYGIQYSFLHCDGFSTAHDSSGNINFDRDGYTQNALLSNIQLQLTKRLSLKLYGQYSKYKTDLDAGAFIDEKDYTSTSKNIQAGVAWIYRGPQTTIHLNYQYSTVNRDYLDDSVYRSNPYVYYSKSNYTGLTHYAESYINRKWKWMDLLGGLDLRHNKSNQDYFSYGIYGPYQTTLKDSLAKMWQLSPYTSIVLRSGNGLAVELGGRWNYHSAYGNNFTYTINPFYHFNKNVKVFANLYTAFKTPSLYQLFDPFAGNKDLKPEKSTSVEAGIEVTASEGFYSRFVYFYGNTKDAIQYIITNPTLYTSLYQNVSMQKNNGIELEVSKKISKWKLDANYTYTEGKTTSGYDGTGNKLNHDTTYNNLYRVPKHALNIGVGIQVNSHFFTSLQLRSRSKRMEAVYGGAPLELGGYYTLDLYGDYHICKTSTVFIDLKNITNQEYFDSRGFNCRRFNFSAGFRFQL